MPSEVYRLILVHVTPSAILVQEVEDGPEIWLPKKLVEVTQPDPKRAKIIDVSIPDWLAEREGLV